MNRINDGGPVFPGQWYDFQPCTGDQIVREQWSGMTLRDYFAAKAMAALIAEPVSEGWPSTVSHWASQLQRLAQMSGPDVVAHVAYMMADAMLKAREAIDD